MFISFFTGKVMLFYGISLIMKEKSNASALQLMRMLTSTEVRLHYKPFGITIPIVYFTYSISSGRMLLPFLSVIFIFRLCPI